MKLIRERRKKKHLSQRKAGLLIPGKPLSDTRWRQLEDGGRIIRGILVPESAPPATLAGMAYVVGVTPAELHAEGRHDAATELAQLIEERAREDGTMQAEANQMAAMVRGLTAGQKQALAREIAQGLSRIREQGR